METIFSIMRHSCNCWTMLLSITIVCMCGKSVSLEMCDFQDISSIEQAISIHRSVYGACISMRLSSVIYPPGVPKKLPIIGANDRI